MGRAARRVVLSHNRVGCCYKSASNSSFELIVALGISGVQEVIATSAQLYKCVAIPDEQ